VERRQKPRSIAGRWKEPAALLGDAEGRRDQRLSGGRPERDDDPRFDEIELQV
jgi:hypothetical protein